MKKLNKAIKIVFFFLITISLGATEFPGDSLISLNITNRLLEDGQNLSTSERLSLVDRALEFDSQNHEAWYLKALYLLEDQKHTLTAIDCITKALEFKSADQYIELLAKVYHRTKQVENAKNLFSAYKNQILLNPECAYYFYDLLGPDQESYETVINLYRSTDPVWALLIKNSEFLRLEYQNWLLESGPSEFHRIAMLHVLNNTVISDTTFNSLYEYFKIVYPEFENKYRGADMAFIKRYHRLPPYNVNSNNRLYLLSLISVADNSNSYDTVQAFLSTYTGVLFDDSDFNGYSETSFFIENGTLTKIFSDSNQDGLNEIEVYFNDYAVKRIVIDEKIEILYDFYPYVKEVHKNSQYLFNPYSFTFYLIDKRLNMEPEFFLLLPWMFSTLDISTEQLYQNAVKIVTNTKTGIEHLHLINGSIQYKRKDSNLDGIFDVTIDYENGLPVRGVRDINFDGFNDIAQIYDQTGSLTAFEVDLDNSGVPEYRKFLLEKFQEWDINEDGVVDIKEIEINKNENMLLVSSYMDGIFDYILIDESNED